MHALEFFVANVQKCKDSHQTCQEEVVWQYYEISYNIFVLFWHLSDHNKTDALLNECKVKKSSVAIIPAGKCLILQNWFILSLLKTLQAIIWDW